MAEETEGREGGGSQPSGPENGDLLGVATWMGLHRVRARIAGLPGRLVTREGALRGIGVAIQLGVVVFGMAMGAHLHTGGGFLVDVAVGALLAVLLLGLAEGVLEVSLRVVRAGLLVLGSLGLAGLVALLLLLWPLGRVPFMGAFALAILAVVGLAMAGAGLGALAGDRRGSVGTAPGVREARPKPSRSTAWGIATAGFLVIAGLIVLLVHPGSAGHLLPPPPVPEGLGTLPLPDPGEPGPREVEAWTYGAGTDRWRPEYGEGGVRFQSASVDGSALLGAWSGWRGRLRTAWWGFGPDALPLNARVWSPAGEGPFPLVLLVHGNHPMSRFSDPGYAYLGRHLASWGYVVASIDQNFLNGGWFGGLRPENDARAWLLLEHLSLWRRWREGGEHEVARRVDLERVVLVGHSRGGEAAAVAAAFNRLVHYPDDASLVFDYGFGIRGVVALAPSDGQYRPAGRRTPLRDVSYLVVQGGHDADVSSFVGDRQFDRVTFTVSPEREVFKSAFYIHEANHGQFNTVWGARDRVPPWGWLLNRAPLLEGDEQQRVARVVLTAFLEAAVRERAGYRGLFQDPRLARDWLPAATYLARYREPGFLVIADFEEDVDVLTGTFPGSLIDGSGLSLWRQQDVGLRGEGLRERQAVALGWRRRSGAAEGEASGTTANPSDDPPAPEYRIHLPVRFGEETGLDAGAALVFSAAALDRAPAGWQEDRTLRSPSAPLVFSVALEDTAGRSAVVSLAEIGPLHPPLEARFAKIPFLERAFGEPTEPVFRDVAIAMDRFLEVEPWLEPTSLRRVVFRFDGSPEGVILLDEVGFSLRRPDARPPWLPRGGR